MRCDSRSPRQSFAMSQKCNRGNSARRRTMSAENVLPKRKTLRTLSQAVDGCRGCELYKHATQGVMGEGPRTARVVLIGEQPGDSEDKAGKPFVGPAGRLLDAAL